MFFTFTIDIYERSEKKIFGISRKELEKEKQGQIYPGLHRMTTMCPLLAYAGKPPVKSEKGKSKLF